MEELLKRKIDYLKNKGYEVICLDNEDDDTTYPQSSSYRFTKRISNAYDVEFIISYNEIGNVSTSNSTGCCVKINSTLNAHSLDFFNNAMKNVEIDAEIIRENMTRDKKASELGYYKTRTGDYEKIYDEANDISILLDLRPYVAHPVFIRNNCNLYAEKIDEFKKVLDKASEDRKLLLKYPVEL